MAICHWCEREMRTARSCTVTQFHRQGIPVPLRPSKARRCGDCGVARGGYHHPGCDLQRCPVCRGQLFSCGCRFDEDGPDPDDVASAVELLGVDGNGVPVELHSVGGMDVVVHYDDIPESDITTVDGIRVTTPLRTVIDLAPELSDDELRRMVDHCLDRDMFTVEEAKRRIAEPDMQSRRGAHLLRRLIDGGL